MCFQWKYDTLDEKVSYAALPTNVSDSENVFIFPHQIPVLHSNSLILFHKQACNDVVSTPTCIAKAKLSVFGQKKAQLVAWRKGKIKPNSKWDGCVYLFH